MPKVDKILDLYTEYKTGSGVLISEKHEMSRNKLNDHPVMQKSVSDINISYKQRAAYQNKDAYDDSLVQASQLEACKKNRLGVSVRHSHQFTGSIPGPMPLPQHPPKSKNNSSVFLPDLNSASVGVSWEAT